MALCSLPRTNPGNRKEYVRRNGPYALVMTAGGLNKLPFGKSTSPLAGLGLYRGGADPKPRARPGDLAVRVHGQAGHGSRRRCSDPAPQPNGPAFCAHVQLIYEDQHAKQFVSSAIADRGEFWWDPKRPDERMLWESKIYLGEAFFNEIIRHPVPLDMNTLKALKRSPLGLDWYLWLTYRTFALKRPLRLSWASLYRQFGANPAQAGDKNTVNNFRTKCLRELKKIKLAWPELNYTTAQGVLILHPSTPSIAPSDQLGR